MLLLLLAACGPKGPSDAPPMATSANPNVVIFTVDTTRADHLGCYGYAGASTPTIDKLASDGVRYLNAVSPIPLTIPAHASLFTGLFPYHHGIRENGDGVLAPSYTTLAERFKSLGYHTGASTAAFVTTRQFGFSQGFDAYFDELPEVAGGNYWHDERPGDQVVDDALQWLDTLPKEDPVFLWVHLYDAHYPYVAHDGQPDALRARPYDSELAFVDQQISRVLTKLEGTDTLYVVVGDHGESLGEHGEATHGLFNYDATQHVPWIVSGAGVPPAVVQTPVSTVSLTATLLHALGQAVPDGLDAGPAPSPDATVYAESWQLATRLQLAPHRTLVSGTYKLIAVPKPELYDIVADPDEKTNLADQHPDVVAAMKAKLDALDAKGPSAEGAESMDADTLSQLQALGYVGGQITEDLDPEKLPDPKDFPDVIEIAGGSAERAPGNAEDTLTKLQAAARRRPKAFELYMQQLPILQHLGRTEEANQLLTTIADTFPTSERVWEMLANRADREGRTQDALGYARKAATIDPRSASAQETLVDLLFRSGAAEEGLSQATTFLATNPNNFGLAAVLGRHDLFTNDYPNAAKYLALAVTAPNPRRGARTQLAWLLLQAGKDDVAIKLLRSEMRDFSTAPRPHIVLADYYAKKHDWLSAKPELHTLVKLTPKNPHNWMNLAQCEFNLQDYAAARRALDQALALASDDPDVLLLDANLLAKEGQRAQADATFAKAQELNAAREAARAAAAKARGKTPTVATPTPTAPPATTSQEALPGE